MCRVTEYKKGLSSLRLLLCAVTVTQVTHTNISLCLYWILYSVGWSLSYRRFGIIYRLHIQGSNCPMRKLHSGRRLKSRKYILRLKIISVFLNKSTNQIHQSLRFIACRLNIAQHDSVILMPIIRSLSTAVAASGLPLERGDSSVVGRGRSGPITTNNTAITTFQR